MCFKGGMELIVMTCDRPALDRSSSNLISSHIIHNSTRKLNTGQDGRGYHHQALSVYSSGIQKKARSSISSRRVTICITALNEENPCRDCGKIYWSPWDGTNQATMYTTCPFVSSCPGETAQLQSTKKNKGRQTGSWSSH